MSCNSMHQVIIATKNTGKLEAAKRVIRRFCGAIPVSTTSAPGGLPAQPVGGLEVFRGALLRALKAYRDLEATGLGIGLEAGLLEFYSGNGYVEGEVCVIVGPDERVSVGTSSLFPLPSSIVERMKRGIELSALIAKRKHMRDLGESIGYIGLATRGFITRFDLHVEAIAMALLPWVEGFEYDLPSVSEYSRILGEV